MKMHIRIIITSPTPFTIKKNSVVTEFHITTPNEAKNNKPFSVAALKFLTEDDSEQALAYVNELLKTTEKPKTSQQFWFPTPDTENPGDPSSHTPVQKRILREIEELEEIQKLNATTCQEDRQKFLEYFEGMILNKTTKTEKISKTYSSNTMTYSPATAWTLASTMTLK